MGNVVETIRKTYIPGTKHIVSSTFPFIYFLDTQVKCVKYTCLVRKIFWIDLFVTINGYVATAADALPARI